ncbi:MAG: hypothetical protein PHG25_04250, partial [Candidatus Pacebacteria bacterium]|nr:hypothetical protein [Candidatus Paceibacterota bacterium]
MKNISLKYSIIGVVVIIILITFVVGKSGKNISPSETASSTVQIAQNTQTSAQNNVTVSPVKNTTVAPVTTKVSSGLNYTDYVKQQNANQNKCNSAALTQYQQMYSYLSESSYNTNYSATSGGCYVRVTGKTQEAYSTTTAGHIYFRNVNTSSMIAECINH